MSANVRRDVFSDAGFFFDKCKLLGICGKGDLWQLVFVAFQNIHHKRKKYDVKLCSGLYAGSAWKYQVSIVVFGCGEIGGHEVRKRKAGVTLNQKEIERDSS